MNDFKQELSEQGVDLSFFSKTASLKNLPFYADIADYTHVVLLGNSKKIWPKFVQKFQQSPHLQAASNPLDSYVENIINSALAKIGPANKVFYVHKQYGEDYFPFARVAQEVGFSKILPCGLSFHPKYGLWFSFRCLVFLSLKEQALLDEAVTIDVTCPQCLQAKRGDDLNQLRLTCSVGREFKFGENQRSYHSDHQRRFIVEDG